MHYPKMMCSEVRAFVVAKRIVTLESRRNTTKKYLGNKKTAKSVKIEKYFPTNRPGVSINFTYMTTSQINTELSVYPKG